MSLRFLFSLLFTASAVFAFGQGTVKAISVGEFNQSYQSRKAGAVLIDVRTPQEFAAGHLAGAININISDPNFDSKIAQLDHSKACYVYCRSGGRSAAASRRLVAAYKEVIDMRGGIIAWQGAGLTLVH